MLTRLSRHTVNTNRTRRKARRGRTYSRLACFEQLENRLLLATYSIDPNPDVQIPDPGTVMSTLTVADSFTIADINVTLDIIHTRDKDLDIFLIGPGPANTRVELFTDVGGNGDNFANTTLDDEAATAITAGSAPFTDSFRPEGLLSDVDEALAELLAGRDPCELDLQPEIQAGKKQANEEDDATREVLLEARLVLRRLTHRASVSDASKVGEEIGVEGAESS